MLEQVLSWQSPSNELVAQSESPLKWTDELDNFIVVSTNYLANFYN
jgi:hypothetical protein